MHQNESPKNVFKIFRFLNVFPATNCHDVYKSEIQPKGIRENSGNDRQYIDFFFYIFRICLSCLKCFKDWALGINMSEYMPNIDAPTMCEVKLKVQKLYKDSCKHKRSVIKQLLQNTKILLKHFMA